MSRTTFNARHDEAAANSTIDPVDRTGRCKAHGCPNIWTTMSTGLCRWHSAAPSFEWPQITEALNTEIAMNSIERHRPAPRVAVMSKADKIAVLEQLRGLFTSKPIDPKAWAYALRKREQDGELLSVNQRTMWRAAIDSPGDYAQVDIDRLARMKADSAASVARYARERGLAL